MVIKWTLLAKNSLRDIYLFYLPTAGEAKAKKIVQQLKEETMYLGLFPQMGASETVDCILTPYRYLVKDHFKIYYTVQKAHIRIAFVWDTRQDPELLTKLLK